MFILLSLVNLLLLGIFVFVYKKFTHIVIPMFFAFYYFIFFIARPYGQVYFDIGLDASYPIIRYSIQFQVAGILFLATMIALGWWVRFDKMKIWSWPLTYPFTGQMGYALAFIVFLVMSYGANVIRYRNVFYVVSGGDVFAAEMSMANGSWFINVLAGMIGIAAIAWLSSMFSRVSARKSFLILLVVILLMMVIGKDSARTNFMIILLAWVISYPNLIKMGMAGAIRLSLAGYLCVAFMILYGQARTGNLGGGLGGGLNTQLLAAFDDTRPSDNALLLFDHYSAKNYMHFKYLAGAITPACLIPTKLLPMRPQSNKDEQLTNEIFPLGIDRTYYHEGSTLTFTVPASGYADFGWPGVIVSSLIYGAIYLFYARLAQVHSSTKLIATFLLLGHIAALRLSTETCLVGFYTNLLIFGFYKAISYIRFRFVLGPVDGQPMQSGEHPV